MHTLARWLTLALFVCASACQAQPPLGRMDEVTGALNMPDGALCSATAIGPHAIITAAHVDRGMLGDPVYTFPVYFPLDFNIQIWRMAITPGWDAEPPRHRKTPKWYVRPQTAEAQK